MSMCNDEIIKTYFNTSLVKLLEGMMNKVKEGYKNL